MVSFDIIFVSPFSTWKRDHFTGIHSLKSRFTYFLTELLAMKGSKGEEDTSGTSGSK